ncbi:hypothetical protein THIOM_003026, partial [Candidatus Thiomargarita nelsonii]
RHKGWERYAVDMIILLFIFSRSHALRGNACLDALRRVGGNALEIVHDSENNK